MGKRGPPPKPPALKKAQGTYRKSRDPGPLASPPPGAPPCPTILDEGARRVWLEVVPQLLEIGTLAKCDGGTLQGYCMTLSRAETLDAIAAKQPIVKTPFGPKLNPAVDAARKLWPVVEKFALDLGLNYASRSRNKVPEKPKDDPAEAFLFGEKPQLQVVNGGKGASVMTPPKSGE